MSGADPFEVLGLRHDPGLSDAEVGAAFRARLRRVHPDAAGGQADAGEAAAVTAAFSALRSASRRGEVLAGLALDVDVWGGVEVGPPWKRPGLVEGPAMAAPRERAAPGGPGVVRERAADGVQGRRRGRVWRGYARVRYGRPGRLAARVVVAAGAAVLAGVVAPGAAAVPGVAVGVVTWLVVTGRYDLAPRARR